MAGVVTVACKLPNGLVLNEFKMEKRMVVGKDGPREVTMAVQTNKQVRLHGFAHPIDKAPQCQIVAGYALTPNVDAEFFANWMKDNADSDLVVKGLIFGYEKPDTVNGKARERDKLRSGLEALDSSRMPRGLEKATTN